MAPNISLFTLPLYWLVAILPRALSGAYLTRHATPGTTSSLQDNASPHASALQAQIQRNLSPSAYATYERLQAAHRNSMENIPLFFGAVIAANFARLNALELDLCSWLYVGLRMLYVVLYVAIEKGNISYARSATFGASVFLCWWLLLRAAVFVVEDYEGR